MKIYPIAVATALCLALSAAPALAGSEPIPGIDIIVQKKPGGQALRVATSDREGRFVARIAEPGEYTLSTSCRVRAGCPDQAVDFAPELRSRMSANEASASGALKTYSFRVTPGGPLLLSGRVRQEAMADNRFARTGVAARTATPPPGAGADGGTREAATVTGRVTNAQGQPEAAAVARPGGCVLRPGGPPCETGPADPAPAAGLLAPEYSGDRGRFLGSANARVAPGGCVPRPGGPPCETRPGDPGPAGGSQLREYYEDRGRFLGSANARVAPGGCVPRPGAPPCDAGPNPGDGADPAGLRYAYGTAGGRPSAAARGQPADRNRMLAGEVEVLAARPVAGARPRPVGRLARGQRVLVDHCEGGWCLLSWDGGEGWVSATQAGLDGFWWEPLPKHKKPAAK